MLPRVVAYIHSLDVIFAWLDALDAVLNLLQ